MDYELLDHEADVGIRTYGETIEKAFENGAKALFSIMVDLEKIESKRAVSIECDADEIEELFVEWLNELLAEKDLEEMSFSKFEVTIHKEGEGYRLEGKAWGEQFDFTKHGAKLEVKAATYFGLRMGKKNDKIFIECVVDV